MCDSGDASSGSVAYDCVGSESDVLGASVGCEYDCAVVESLGVESEVCVCVY